MDLGSVRRTYGLMMEHSRRRESKIVLAVLIRSTRDRRVSALHRSHGDRRHAAWALANQLVPGTLARGIAGLTRAPLLPRALGLRLVAAVDESTTDG